MSATSGEAKSTRANGTSSSHQLPAGSKEAERRHPLNDTREVSVDAEDMDMIEPDSDKDAAASSARTISTTKKHRGLRRSRVCPGTDSENSAPLLKAAPYRQLTTSLPFEEGRQTRYLHPRKGLPRAQPIWLVVNESGKVCHDGMLRIVCGQPSTDAVGDSMSMSGLRTGISISLSDLMLRLDGTRSYCILSEGV